MESIQHTEALNLAIQLKSRLLIINQKQAADDLDRIINMLLGKHHVSTQQDEAATTSGIRPKVRTLPSIRTRDA